jgi:hypothetical protein
VVVPADTEMGENVTRLGVGTTFARYQPASIAHAVSQAVRHYAPLRAAAERVAKEANPVREADDYLNHLMKVT